MARTPETQSARWSARPSVVRAADRARVTFGIYWIYSAYTTTQQEMQDYSGQPCTPRPRRPRAARSSAIASLTARECIRDPSEVGSRSTDATVAIARRTPRRALRTSALAVPVGIDHPADRLVREGAGRTQPLHGSRRRLAPRLRRCRPSRMPAESSWRRARSGTRPRKRADVAVCALRAAAQAIRRLRATSS